MSIPVGKDLKLQLPTAADLDAFHRAWFFENADDRRVGLEESVRHKA